MTSGLYTAVIWAAFVYFIWYQARRAENQRLPDRPKHDVWQMLGAALLLGVAFIGLLLLLPLVFVFPFSLNWSPRGPTDIAVVVIELVVITVALFMVGLYFSRRSEGRSTTGVFKEAIGVVGVALLIIAAIGTWMAIGTYLHLDTHTQVWSAGWLLAAAVAIRTIFQLRHKRRFPPKSE